MNLEWILEFFKLQNIFWNHWEIFNLHFIYFSFDLYYFLFLLNLSSICSSNFLRFKMV